MKKDIESNNRNIVNSDYNKDDISMNDDIEVCNYKKDKEKISVTPNNEELEKYSSDANLDKETSSDDSDDFLDDIISDVSVDSDFEEEIKDINRKIDRRFKKSYLKNTGIFMLLLAILLVCTSLMMDTFTNRYTKNQRDTFLRLHTYISMTDPLYNLVVYDAKSYPFGIKSVELEYQSVFKQPDYYLHSKFEVKPLNKTGIQSKYILTPFSMIDVNNNKFYDYSKASYIYEDKDLTLSEIENLPDSSYVNAVLFFKKPESYANLYRKLINHPDTELYWMRINIHPNMDEQSNSPDNNMMYVYGLKLDDIYRGDSAADYTKKILKKYMNKNDWYILDKSPRDLTDDDIKKLCISLNNSISEIQDLKFLPDASVVSHFNNSKDDIHGILLGSIPEFNKFIEKQKTLVSDVAIVRTSKKEILSMLNNPEVQAANILHVYLSSYNID